MTTPIASMSDGAQTDDIDYTRLRENLAKTETKEPLFTTDAGPLYDTVLAMLPESIRPTYVCRSCRDFIDRIGSLVRIGESGRTYPALRLYNNNWPGVFERAAAAVAERVERAKVTGAFLAADKVFGTPMTKDKKGRADWRHLYCPNAAPYSHPIRTAEQRMAEIAEDFRTLSRGLAEFKHETVLHAISILCGGDLYRGEKFLGVAEWLDTLHRHTGNVKDRSRKDNIVWLAVATAPAGFAHIRSTMIGTLLDDLQSGMSADFAARRFKEKMHPLQYQRPTAEVNDGQIDAAEKIIAKLDSARALDRRFARIEDIPETSFIWRPVRPTLPAEGGGVFSSLRKPPHTKKAGPSTPTTMTWVKFAERVLPEVRAMTVRVPRHHQGFSALITAASMDAPPILQWDIAEARNPLSWYFYYNGTPAQAWNLRAGDDAEVTAIVRRPGHEHGAFLLLKDARDVVHTAGGGFFPETLKPEYHAIRKVVERFTTARRIEGREQATACGLGLHSQSKPDILITTVDMSFVEMHYHIDRWD